MKQKGPKRILALDGGGIRGAISLGFLAKIETTLRKRYNNPNLLLCDYYDLIGGTSTGAIIAACLAIGMSVDEICRFYLDFGGKVFGKKKWKQWTARFDERPLVEQLRNIFCEKTLGDSSLRTGICIITKRADTGSTWPFINHPDGQFYDDNKAIKIWEILRASAAAPVIFLPLPMEFQEGQKATFIDGGISLAANPALQLFLVATLKGFPFHWSKGEDNLLVTSIGTGCWPYEANPEKIANSDMVRMVATLPALFMHDAQWHNQMFLQLMSKSLTPWPIDMEVGDLSDDLLAPEPLLTYLRYDISLTPEELEKLGLPHLSEKYKKLHDMSNAANRFDLKEIGDRAAEKQIDEIHFPSSFDLSSPFV